MKILSQFPDAFYPLVIVTADRRENPPKTRGDLLASSGSPGDLMYLPALGLRRDVQIVSDKTFVLLERSELEARFGQKNLLVIGSPDTNLLSRVINSGSVFRFNIPPETHEKLALQESIINQAPFATEWLQTYRQVTGGRSVEQCLESFRRRGIVYPDEMELRRLYDEIERRCRETGLKNLKGLLRELAATQLVDPVSATVHAKFIPPDRDFGLVSLAQNPFSSDGACVAILVAGVHLPGTAQGVRVLGQPRQFEQYPCGGVFRVDINVGAAWPDRINGMFKWNTEPYSVEKAIRVLKVPTEPLPGLSSEESRKLVSLLEGVAQPPSCFLSIQLSKGQGVEREAAETRAKKIAEAIEGALPAMKLVCQNPYEGKFYGNSFVDDVLDQLRDASFIVHDLTGWPPGVLVEVGISIGLGARRLLYWDTKHIPWKAPRGFLAKTHVHQIHDAEAQTGSEILQRRLVDLMEPRNAVTPKRQPPVRNAQSVLIVAPETRTEQRKGLVGALLGRGLAPMIEDDIRGSLAEEGVLDAACRAVREAGTVIVVYDEDYLDGLLVLGMAQASHSNVILFVHAHSSSPSVFAGREYRWHEATFQEDMHRALATLSPTSMMVPNAAWGETGTSGN